VGQEHGDALDPALMILDEQDVLFERPDIFPALHGRGVDKQVDLPLLADEFIDLRRDRSKIIGLQLRGRGDFGVSGEKVLIWIIDDLPRIDLVR
jgi:hypothetical protein